MEGNFKKFTICFGFLVFIEYLVIAIIGMEYTGDFGAFYYGTRAVFSDWSKLYSLDYYASFNVCGFVYIPQFCLLIGPMAILPFPVSQTIFTMVSGVCGFLGVYLFGEILSKQFSRNNYDRYILLALYGIYIQHFWNANMGQRGEISAFLIILFVYLENRGTNPVILDLVFSFYVSSIPYMLLVYGYWILKQGKIRRVVQSVLIMGVLNFPIVFLLGDLTDLFFSGFAFDTRENLYIYEYSAILTINYLSGLQFTTEVFIIGMGSILVFLTVRLVESGKDTRILAILPEISTLFLFVNPLLRGGPHLISLYPWVLLYISHRIDGFSKKHSIPTLLAGLLAFCGLVLIAIPIPYAVFAWFKLGEYSYLKRMVSYCMLIPAIVLRKSKAIGPQLERK